MIRPYEHDPFPQSEQEYLRRQEQHERLEQLREIEKENNGEFRTLDPETGCTPEEMRESKPAQSAYQQMNSSICILQSSSRYDHNPAQMELFDRKEVA